MCTLRSIRRGQDQRTSPLPASVAPGAGDYQITTYQPSCELALETTSGGPARPTERYELTSTHEAGAILRSVIEYQAQGLVRFALPTLALQHPLFASEASWIDKARDAVSAGTPTPSCHPYRRHTAAPSHSRRARQL